MLEYHFNDISFYKNTETKRKQSIFLNLYLSSNGFVNY